jgi:carboxyl-terminal processing protease
MRGTLACLGVVGCSAALLLANPTREEKRAGPPIRDEEAAVYATQLKELSHFISEQYYLEIAETDLLAAGLRGLYEAAGVAAPPRLSAEVQSAAGHGDYALRKLIAHARRSLGNPGPLQDTGAIYVSLRAMMQKLDPFSAVLRGPEMDQLRPIETVKGFGLELVSESPDAKQVIKSVIPGGPAQRIGLRPGDQITHLNGEPVVAGETPPVTHWKTDMVRLTLARPGGKYPLKATLKSDIFRPEMVLGISRKEDNSWDYFIDPERRIAHIRVTFLSAASAEELARVLRSLEEAKLRGLILDFRWCPGGYLDPARDMADLFFGDYNLTGWLQPTPASLLGAAPLFLNNHCQNATVRYRENRPDDRLQHSYGSFTNFPVVVLVNGETTGGAELVAAVLQDNRRAFVAGQRTRGKASVQRQWSLRGEIHGLTLSHPIESMGLKLTNGILVRPSGKNLNRWADSKPSDDWGVRPEPKLEFWVSPELSHQLQTWWQMQSIRPPSDHETLPLDDPTVDPQRQSALHFLQHILRPGA